MITPETEERRRLIARLEGCELRAGEFGHADHVRAARWYLQADGLDEGGRRFAAAARRLATHLGAAEIYHDTVTWALLRLIWARMADGPDGENWNGFHARNADLLLDARALLARYYSETRLSSDAARARQLPPDLEPFPEVRHA